MDNNKVLDTVTLPNGGVVQLDKLAYKALQGCSNTYDYHTHEWTTQIEFKSDKIETAVAYENTNREYR